MTHQNRNRALRNLAIAAALCFATWLLLGAPLPTQTLRMHRAERQNLVERSQIVWRYHRWGDLNDSGYFSEGTYTLVGVTPVTVYTYMWRLEAWARNPDGPTLVGLPMYLDWPGGVGGTRGLLAVDPPAGAESARLTLTLEIEYGFETDRMWYSEEYQEEAVRDGECFFFTLTRHHPDNVEDPLWGPEHALFSGWESKYDGEGYFAAPYTLEFFDRDGVLIGSWENSV